MLFEGRHWTWAEVDRQVGFAADTLLGFGLGSGDRVAVRAWNTPALAWTFFACGRIGATFAPLNARLTTAECSALLERVGARWWFGDLPKAQPLSELFTIAALPDAVSPATVDDDDVAVGLFTSGTTGVSKLVELTHGNLRASAEANAQRLGGDAEQRWLGTLPLFHVGGLAMLYRCALYGASIVLEPSFDAARASAAMDAGVTHVSLVPTMLDRLIDVRGGRPFSGVRAALIGGGPMTSAQLQRARAAGLPVLQTYGLTEACSQVTTEVPAEADGRSAGSPLPGIEVRIAAPDAEGVGEIEVRGPTVAKGLGPWLQTKDLGCIDAQGRLTVMSRRVDLIVSGGENVYPAEVEGVLREHPAVREIAVIGRADETWGQVPVAVYVGEAVDAEQVRAWAKERLASFKVPREWVRVEALPRNATGKLERGKLLVMVG